MDADGDFVVAWRGPGQDDTLGVFAQRGEVLVNTAPPALMRRANTPVPVPPLPPWLGLAQTTTKSPSASIPIACESWWSVVNTLARSSGPTAVRTSITFGNQTNPAVAMDADGDLRART